ncbi:MAG: polysaccharide pyruvyl transferase family protein [Marinicella sp.]
MEVKIKNMSFPNQDVNWIKTLDYLKEHRLVNLKTLAPVEFSAVIDTAYPYEWSYWNEITEFDLLIVHKGLHDRIDDRYLKCINEDHEYIYGNAVFMVYLRKNLNVSNLKGHDSHFSLSAILNSLKNLIHSFKQYKVNSSKKNILLVTANHCGNVGDDAITMASKDLLESIYPDANIVVDKGPCSKKLLAKVDLVVLGGGGIFYDSCFYNAQNYCQYLLYAKSYGIRCVAIGVGAQGIMTQFGKELFKQALNCCEFIAVRDQVSFEILKNRVATKTEVVLNRDVVFSFVGEESDIEIKKSDKPLLLFSLLDASHMRSEIVKEGYRSSQYECLELLNEKFNLKCFTQSEDDLPFYEKIREDFGVDIIRVDYEHARTAVSLYKQADLVMTSRLHGFIFAALAQVPVLSVSFDSPRTKLGGLIRNYLPSALKGILPLNDYSLETLNEKLKIFEANRDDLIVDKTELNDCKNLVLDLKNIFKEKIANL